MERTFFHLPFRASGPHRISSCPGEQQTEDGNNALSLLLTLPLSLGEKIDATACTQAPGQSAKTERHAPSERRRPPKPPPALPPPQLS